MDVALLSTEGGEKTFLMIQRGYLCRYVNCDTFYLCSVDDSFYLSSYKTLTAYTRVRAHTSVQGRTCRNLHTANKRTNNAFLIVRRPCTYNTTASAAAAARENDRVRRFGYSRYYHINETDAILCGRERVGRAKGYGAFVRGCVRKPFSSLRARDG